MTDLFVCDSNGVVTPVDTATFAAFVQTETVLVGSDSIHPMSGPDRSANVITRFVGVDDVLWQTTIEIGGMGIVPQASAGIAGIINWSSLAQAQAGHADIVAAWTAALNP